ncbi:hypothetical protein [Streptomyces pristinaespiralis]
MFLDYARPGDTVHISEMFRLVVMPKEPAGQWCPRRKARGTHCMVKL